MTGVLDASRLLRAGRKLCASISSTPTIYIVKSLKARLLANLELKIHASI